MDHAQLTSVSKSTSDISCVAFFRRSIAAFPLLRIDLAGFFHCVATRAHDNRQLIIDEPYVLRYLMYGTSAVFQSIR